MRTVGFLLTFLGAWFVLDRLVTSPPMPASALVALAGAAAVVAIGERLVYRTPWRDLPIEMGFGRPTGRALAVGGVVGGLVIAGYVLGAQALGITLELRPEWPLVLVGVLVFHGLAEELVWRGFVFHHLRDGRTFRRAVLASMPLIALTHVPIIVSSGLLVGGLALLTAAITCLPLAYLWERGGRTIWAPALVHGLIGTWQLFERTYPMTFSIVVLVVTLVVPLLALAFRDRFFGRSIAPATAPVQPVFAPAAG
jgi:membrane protease YdiL (CAAX protease family)